MKTSEMSQDELVRVTTAAASVYSYKNSNVERMLSSIGPSASLKLNLPQLLQKDEKTMFVEKFVGLKNDKKDSGRSKVYLK
jgi:hypothetical protein